MYRVSGQEEDKVGQEDDTVGGLLTVVKVKGRVAKQQQETDILYCMHRVKSGVQPRLDREKIKDRIICHWANGQDVEELLKLNDEDEVSCGDLEITKSKPQTKEQLCQPKDQSEKFMTLYL